MIAHVVPTTGPAIQALFPEAGASIFETGQSPERGIAETLNILVSIGRVGDTTVLLSDAEDATVDRVVVLGNSYVVVYVSTLLVNFPTTFDITNVD